MEPDAQCGSWPQDRKSGGRLGSHYRGRCMLDVDPARHTVTEST